MPPSRWGGSVLEDADTGPVVLVKGVAAGSPDPRLDQLHVFLISERGASRIVGQNLAGLLVLSQRFDGWLLVRGKHETVKLRVDDRDMARGVDVGEPVVRAVVVCRELAHRDVVETPGGVTSDGRGLSEVKQHLEAEFRLPLSLDLPGQGDEI